MTATSHSLNKVWCSNFDHKSVSPEFRSRVWRSVHVHPGSLVGKARLRIIPGSSQQTLEPGFSQIKVECDDDQVSVDQQNREYDDPDEEGVVDGLVGHGPRAQGTEQPDGGDQADDTDDVQNHPDENPDSLSLEIALQQEINFVNQYTYLESQQHNPTWALVLRKF